MRFLSGVASILVFLLLAPGASAQEGSLAGLAKKTKEEREEKKGESKVIGSDDLRRAKGRVYVPPAEAGPAPSAAADEEGQQGAGDEAAASEEGDEEPTPAEERAALTEQLRSELALQRDRVSKLQEQIADAQAQLADQTTYYPGNPRRASLEELIEKCNAEIADARSTIADLQRRARAQGIALR